MRLACISTMSGFPWGGSEELWSAAAREAIEAGWSVGMSTRQWPELPRGVTDLVENGVAWWPWSESPMPVPPQEPPRRTRLSRLKKRLLRQPDDPPPAVPPPVSWFAALFATSPEVICISQGGTFDFLEHDDLCELVYASARPYVVLCRFNTDDFPIDEALRPKAVAFFTRAHRVAFAAERNLTSAERQLALEIPRASVIQSPIGLPDFAAATWPSEATARLACVARLDARCKGHDLLFESLSTPAWKARDWTLSLYGEGPDRARYRELIDFFGLTTRIELVGHVQDIAAIWSTHHLLVLPSRAEGTPQSLIQAMVCGRPSVVTDVGGASDWVEEPTTGFLAEAATVPSISRSLERAWQARADWPAIGRTAHLRALSRIDRTPGKTLFRLLQSAVGVV